MRPSGTMHQEAQRDIYNVSGDLTINNYYLDEKKKILIKDTAKNQETINYVKNLNISFEEKKIINRKVYFEELDIALKEDKQVLIFGEPGVGKTAILNEISLNKEAIYVSMKNMSPLRMMHYLINSISVKLGLEFDNDCNIEASMLQFEELLAKTELLFLIDDCEAYLEFVASIIDVEKFRNNFIFVSRNKNVISKYPIQKVHIKPLNEEEIREFLFLHNVNLKTATLNEVIDASNGNPLFLYYFIKYQITPIPRGLQAFQEAIWNNIDDVQKNILSLVSVCIFPIELNILNLTINRLHNIKLNPLQFNKELAKISALLTINDGKYELFHPFFSDFIKQKLDNSGLSNWYKEELGKIFFDKGNYIDAIPLLMDINDKDIYPELLNVFPHYIEWGYWDLAISVLNKFLTLNEDKLSVEYGYAHYHLSNCYRHQGVIYLTRTHIDEAIRVFTEIENQDWLSIALIWKALDWAEEGKLKEAHKLANEIFLNKPSNEHIEATLLINLAKLYIETLDFENGAEASKKAYEIFKKYKDTKGLITSLVNLSVCLVKLNQLDVALDYSNSLLDFATDNDDEMLEGIVLNTITICHRKLGNMAEAKKACMQCIKIWSRQNQKQKVAMNIINLGNVYRDEKNYLEAETYYQEGLELAIEINFQKEQGRAYELLSNIYREQERYEEAISFAIKAIEKSEAAGDYYRVAEAFIEKAISYEKIGEYENAISAYQESIELYLETKTYNEIIYPLINIIKLYTILEESEGLKYQYEQTLSLIKEEILTVNCEEIERLLKAIKNNYSKNKYLNLYELLLIKTIEKNYYISSRLILSFISDCKENLKLGREKFKDFCIELTKHLNIERYQNILALCFEQSGVLLDYDELSYLFESVVYNLRGIHYRELTDGDILITFSWFSGKMFQIRANSENLQELKVSIAIALILKSNEILFNKCIKLYKEDNFTIYVINQSVLNENVKELPTEAIDYERPAIFFERETLDTFQPIILLDDYGKLTDYTLNPENKAFVWVLIMLFEIVYSHFTHSDLGKADNEIFRKTFINNVLDVFIIDDIEDPHKEVLRDILDAGLYDLKNE
ncbi:tetratricopeptide repeat protein [Priestia sp. JSM ZJ58]|uniref:tetratricopeptide repeat protein n=1 Tax=Priestia sp. JSM ZJ58 TaxID=3376189 RepID=UPI00378DE384